ncbi:hypothetical protein EON80_00500 [bacterium]|nr:MAG: hypothetical protein EON80_00500 [bacterium]
MLRSQSLRPVLGLFALSLGLCGLLFLTPILSGRVGKPKPSDLSWKNPVWAKQVAFTPDGSTVVTLDISGNCARWDAKTGRSLSSRRFLDAQYLTPDGASVVGLDYGKPGKKFSMPNWPDSLYPVSKGLVVTRGSNKQLVYAYPYTNRVLKSFDIQSGQLQWKQHIPERPEAFRLSSDEILAVSNDHVWLEVRFPYQGLRMQKNVHVFSRREGRLIKSVTLPYDVDPERVAAPVFLRNGDLLYNKNSWSRDKDPSQVDYVELQSESGPRRFKLGESQPGLWLESWEPMAFNKDFELLAGTRPLRENAYNSREIFLWGAQGQLRWKIQQADFIPRNMSFSPDSRYLAIGGIDQRTLAQSNDGRLIVYEVATGKVVKELTETTWVDYAKRPVMKYTKAPTPGFMGLPIHLAWSPDSRQLAVSYGPQGIRVWKIR